MHREGRMATGWVRKSIQATEITLAMFNHIRAGIGRAVHLSHGERSECAAFRVRGLCVTDSPQPLTQPSPMGEGHAVLLEAPYASPPPFAAISAFNIS